MNPIYYRVIKVQDSFSGNIVELDSWSYGGDPGLYDSYVSALAAQSGCWEEYCDYHRRKA